jgi:hypothetical protein
MRKEAMKKKLRPTNSSDFEHDIRSFSGAKLTYPL